MKSTLLFLLTVMLCHSKVSAQTAVKMEDINNHIGDTVKICSKIYDGKYYIRMQGLPTYLYLGNAFPNNPLTVVILKKDRENFEGPPEMMYA